MGRPAQPEEIAPSYVFLASEIDSSFMSGQVRVPPSAGFAPPPAPCSDILTSQVMHPNGGMTVHG